MTEIACGLDGCEYTHTDQCSDEHSWSDYTTARTIGDKPHTVSVVAMVNHSHREPDELGLVIQNEAETDYPAEVWMTVAEAERLHYILGSAMRRLIAFQPARQEGGARCAPPRTISANLPPASSIKANEVAQ